MKLYIMKREALETLKANLPVVYGKYYTEKTNQWISDICGEDLFIEFKDVTEFKYGTTGSMVSGIHQLRARLVRIIVVFR